MANSDGIIVGIDLGTTNSVVAAVVDGKPRILEEEGEKLLPSVVAVDAEGQLITGVIARNQLAAFPDRTVASIKRRMGSMEPVSLGEQTFTPPEISAIILRRLRDRASRALGQPVERAVITVPAFFDENQRQATLEAGQLAGLKVERIINEPTAATLVYHAGSHDPRHIVVYDLGGGTFDVSIVRMEAGVIEVLSSKGDTRLGGDDIDQILLDHVADQFQELHGINLRSDPAIRYRLLRACEQAKIGLSTEGVVRVEEEFIAEKDGQPLNLKTTIAREDFEDLIEPLVARTIACVDDALRDARLTIHQLDDLVLVGGSTRIPLVEHRLREEFLREPSRAVDPDLAVALGAAVQAAMIQGQSVGPVLVDVTGHTLGIEVCEQISFQGMKLAFSPIIHRNSPLPARFEEIYRTLHEEQERVEIHVLQGEYAEVHRNRSIGKFMLNLKPGSGDQSKVVVRFDLTLDGTLTVTATQPATGASEQLTINNALSQFQTHERERAESRLRTMFDASDEFSKPGEMPSGDPPGEAQAAPPGGDWSAKYPRACLLLEQAEQIGPTVTGEDAEELQEIVQQLQEALAAEDSTQVAHLSEQLDDILFYVQ